MSEILNSRMLKKKSISLILAFLILALPLHVFGRAGDLDNTFGSGGKVSYQYEPSFSAPNFYVANAIQSDGKIIFAGNGMIPVTGGGTDGYIVIRYNPNGSVDATFGTNGFARTDVGNFEGVGGAVIQPDGKIIISGERYAGTTATDFAVLRYHPNGTLDNSFDGNGLAVANIVGVSNERVGSVALQPDGKIVLVGQTDMQTNFANMDWAIVRFNTDGSLDTTFGGGTGKVVISLGGNEETASWVALQPDGKIVASGVGTNGSNNDFFTMRFNSDGSIDQTFASNGIAQTPIGNGNDFARSVRIQPDNKIVVAGGTHNGTNNDIALVRYDTNGTLDPSFGTGGIATATYSPTTSEIAYALALQPDGKMVVSSRNGNDAGVVRFEANGNLDNSFGTNGKTSAQILNFTSATSYALSLQNDGKIVISGVASWLSSPGPFYFYTARFLGASSKTPFDFDGDGKTDISIYRPSAGEWWYQRSSNGGNFAAQFGASTDKIAPGDFTGDGKTDIAIWRPSTGEWFVLRSEDQSYYSFPFGTNGDMIAPGDYDSDGKADAAVFRPSTATWYVSRSSGGTTIQQFGLSGDVPAAADYDADGKTDIAIYRVAGGEWWIQRSAAGLIAFQFGNSSDKPVQGDYTGDGKSDVAIWRPSTGEWFVLRSEDQSYYSFPFGTGGDIPAPGDYDGDGKFDAAVFRPSGSTWYVQRSTAGTLIQGFGQSGDAPVPNAFVP